jgi:hypothetical protein
LGENGQSYRILCDAVCVLNFKGIDYRGVIVNVSLTGALIRINDKIPENIHPEDECILMLYEDFEICPIKYKCKIIRIDYPCIGVQFCEMNCFF